ncbi:hypothetical protein AGR13a_Lc10027 [Agrobacterium genomosp. 13 str. CFBP 6927]|uniref:Transposase n=1 Tax=Agrobacterium genomosp. 13 str. CFBP 6927 TaxID=1183428 RepID=A0ABP2BJH8_9HYPH|nr:hypothetical protein AGR13a_Lc10027 [Agrobacterium genomosp. 13 str. CFBP 6927]
MVEPFAGFRDAPAAKAAGKLVDTLAVILGLDPRIHGRARLWILGSSPRMTAEGFRRLCD